MLGGRIALCTIRWVTLNTLERFLSHLLGACNNKRRKRRSFRVLYCLWIYCLCLIYSCACENQPLASPAQENQQQIEAHVLWNSIYFPMFLLELTWWVAAKRNKLYDFKNYSVPAKLLGIFPVSNTYTYDVIPSNSLVRWSTGSKVFFAFATRLLKNGNKSFDQ